MDKYDLLLLEIVHNYKENGLRMNVSLSQLEKLFWKRIESEHSLSINQARIGERITKLYLAKYIENKGGYYVTKKGRTQLEQVTLEAIQ